MEKQTNYKNTPLWDNSLPLEARLDYLVKEITLEELLDLASGKVDIPRLGLDRSCIGGEAAHGIEARRDQEFNKGQPQPTTSFTQPIGMSATWDVDLLRKIGQAVGNEARVIHNQDGKGGLCRWAPTVDMERDPRWGRTEEAYGEDPYLTGKMASAYIRGMRGDDPFYIRCGATLKHFYANNVEQDRIKISSSLDRRNKWEYYYEPFKRAIQEGGAEAMMTAYNEINGVPAMVLDEVQKIVKDQWGLPGHVVTDGGDVIQTVNDHKYFGSHTQTVANGLKAGIDSFTDNHVIMRAALKDAYETGLIVRNDLERAVRNMFSTRLRLGLFDKYDKNPFAHIPDEVLNSKEHQQLSYLSVVESAVLLKNNGILPLSQKQGQKVAIVGPMANVWYKDWYSPIPPYTTTILDAMKNHPSKADIRFSDGLDRIYLKQGENYWGIDADNRIIICCRENAAVFTLSDWGNGEYTLFSDEHQLFVSLDDKEDILYLNKKEAFGWFVREIIRLEYTDRNTLKIRSWDRRPIGVKASQYLSAQIEEEAIFTIEKLTDGIDQAALAAAESDIVIITAGTQPVIGSKEEVDRTHLDLPPAQQQLIQAVYEANPRAVLCLISNYPHAINWENEHLPAILWSASGSQELGRGITALLFGDESPAGRLNMTWYQSHRCLPEMDDYDIIQSKRTYLYYDKEVLYPFGFGLSYTDFSYSNLTIEMNDFTAVRVSCTVKNNGNKISDEVVQLYVTQKGSRAVRPLKMLKGFKRIHALTPGREQQVIMEVPLEDLKYYDVINEDMILERGEYIFQIGASSDDIRLKEVISLQGITPGLRNPHRRIGSDVYDISKNVLLYRGSRGYPGAGPKDTSKKALLVYKDLALDQNISLLEMDIYPETEGVVRFFMDEVCVAEYLCKADKQFIDAEIVINQLPVKEKTVLSIEIEGSVWIASFRLK